MFSVKMIEVILLFLFVIIPIGWVISQRTWKINSKYLFSIALYYFALSIVISHFN